MRDEDVRRLSCHLAVAAGYAQMVLPDSASPTDEQTMANAREAFHLAEQALPVLKDALVDGYRQPGPLSGYEQ